MKNCKNKGIKTPHSLLRDRWRVRIMLNKGFSEPCAAWMVQRLEDLIDHMHYGYALVAFHKQDGTFQLARATLIPYESFFHAKYDSLNIRSAIIYWDVERQAWRSFLLENFLEWSPVG